MLKSNIFTQLNKRKRENPNRKWSVEEEVAIACYIRENIPFEVKKSIEVNDTIFNYVHVNFRNQQRRSIIINAPHIYNSIAIGAVCVIK